MKNNICTVCKKPYDDREVMMVAAAEKERTCICFSCMSKISAMHNSYQKFVPYGSSLSGVERVAEPASVSEISANGNDCPKVPRDVLRPAQIKARLDEYVVGQDKAKRAISVAVYNHYKRTKFQNDEIKKSNIMMVGPTGSGKTYLVETLAKIMNVPVALCTATTLTEAGYIGDDVESVVARLFDICDRDIEKTQHGIIFIDEVDKLCASSSDTEKKVGGKGVQQALLRLLEGTVVSIPVGDASLGRNTKVDIDTSNILFICGGAFPDAEKIIAQRLNKDNCSAIGFTQSVRDEDKDVKENLLLHITTDDLREFGMIPEFLGRLPVIAPLEELSVDTLVRILSVPKGCLLSQYQQLFEYDGIRLDMEEEAMRRIAELAIKKGTGARSLRTIMEDVLGDLMFELPGSAVEEVIITRAFIDKESSPIIHEKALGYGAAGC